MPCDKAYARRGEFTQKMISALVVEWFPPEVIIKKPKYTAFFEPWNEKAHFALSETALDTGSAKYVK